MTRAKVELGRHLFYDPRLSGDASLSCAGCHRPELAFTDGRPRARGATGQLHPRGAMSLVNVAYATSYNWGDGALTRLEDQIPIPLLNQTPIEMGVAGREQEVVARFAEDPRYRELFRAAFGPEPPHNLDPLVQALASFVRSIVSARSPYDRLVYGGEMDAMSPAARRGMDLFHSERLGCAACHGGVAFAGPMKSAEASDLPAELVHNGLVADPEARFKIPTLRNVALTAPYMHDGRLPDLAAVIDHYAAGGAASEAKSPLVGGFQIAEGERRDLIAFLDSLTDSELADDPRFGNPSDDGMIRRAAGMDPGRGDSR